MAFLSEAQLETALLEQLGGLGYACASDEVIGPDGKQPEREAHDEVVLKARLTAAVARLNPALPAEAQADAVRRLTQSELPNLLEENRRIHRLLTEGADVEYYAEDGTLTAGKVRLADFERPTSNDWLAVQQFTVMASRAAHRLYLVIKNHPLAGQQTHRVCSVSMVPAPESAPADTASGALCPAARECHGMSATALQVTPRLEAELRCWP